MRKHGMKNLGYWTAFDPPESAHLLVCLLKHEGRLEADRSWEALRGDGEWRRVGEEPESGLLEALPERLFLEAADFSRTR